MSNIPVNGLVDAYAHSIPTAIEFLLDETGSMKGHLHQTIDGYNDFVAEQRHPDGSCLLTLTKFNTNGLKTPYRDIDIQMVPAMTPKTFAPSGWTNLRDAILDRLNSLEQRLAAWDEMPRVLFVVMTDGEDTCSTSSTQEVATKIRAAIATGWTCVFLGADQNANQIGGTLGFQPGNIRSFASSSMRSTMHELSHATTAFRASATPQSAFFSATAN